MSEPVVRFQEVTRRFGRTVALDRVSFEVQPGTVVGLVGRNGAGKTTALRLAHGTLHPDEGTIRVLGLDPVRHGLEVRRRVSLLSEESHLYPWMRVGEIVRLAGRLHPRWDAGLAQRLCERLGLDAAARIATLSRGERAKVALVLAVACRPDVLLLDDPTAGLDPLVRREVLEGVVESLPGEGGAVVYASHMIQDLERVADEIVLLDAGRVVVSGSLEALKRRLRRVVGVFEDAAPAAVEARGAVRPVSVRREGRLLTAVAAGGEAELSHWLREVGARKVEVEPVSLEEILVAFLRRGSAEAGRG